MIVLRPKGGLGNQCFQYAAARALAERHGVPLCFDLRWYDGPTSSKTTPRTFDLLHFAVDGSTAASGELRCCFPSEDRRLLARVARRLSRVLCGQRLWVHDGLGYDPEFVRLPARTFIEGYFQHPAYFETIAPRLRSEFHLRVPPPPEVVARASELSASSTVCIQVRRGDYITNSAVARVHGGCSEGYFRMAWERIIDTVPGARGYVFADDHGWAGRVFAGWPNVTVVGPEWDGPHYMHKFYLMRSCSHFIIANSTWGWWAAWLGANPQKVVIMPERWFRDEVKNREAAGLRCPGWILC